jgi:hypothetical protein
LPVGWFSSKLAKQEDSTMKKNPTPQPIKRATIRLPQDLWRKATIRALDDNVSLEKVIVVALERYLKEGH